MLNWLRCTNVLLQYFYLQAIYDVKHFREMRFLQTAQRYVTLSAQTYAIAISQSINAASNVRINKMTSTQVLLFRVEFLVR